MAQAGKGNPQEGLARYREKRDFSTTPEPRGGQARSPSGRLAYFVQRHHARRLHYDFRLELNGTLKSWAVPKGPSLDPADKRLAVHVEDHPLDYGTFEGEIPEGQYGAGKVVLWDRGVWFPQGDPEEGMRKGHLKFRLTGNKLVGGWQLVRMHGGGDGKENWLLIKEQDDDARQGEYADIVGRRPESVAGAPEPAALAPAAIDGARQAAQPALIKPQLATLTDRAPPGDEWLMEIKFDGYRALCRIDGDRITLYTRAGNDWTAKWRVLAEEARRLPVRQAWLDGEVVAVDNGGAISFQLLQNLDTDPGTARLVYYVFDLLYLDGYDLRHTPLERRKELLRNLISGAADGAIRFSDHIRGNAEEVLARACDQGLEGVIAKRSGAAYESRRSRNWLKVKCLQRQEFVIGGYTDAGGSRTGFGALLLGVQDNRGLHYAGRVGTGFDAATLERLFAYFQPLRSERPPFINPPKGRDAAGVHWLKPQQVAEVKFAQWTGDGIVRHASFVGLRDDKRASEVHRETPRPVTEFATRAAPAAHRDRIAGVKLSNPSRVLFPDNDISKQELAGYYAAIADRILPHLAHRPLTLVRCPKGITQHCFFQKHANATTSPALTRVAVGGGDAGAEYYLTADKLAALISLVQMDVLELHTWGARRPRLEHPDRMIFDLDPAPDLPWMRVIEAAQLVKVLLEEIGLRCFVKTTGGKGLHIVTPLKAERPWDEVKGFSRAIAYHLARTLPDRFTAKMTKSGRTGKVFIDYLRNGREATAVAAYSTRAKPGAPVSAPVEWEELTEDLRPDRYNIRNMQERLAGLRRDPWEEYPALKQRISAKMLRRFQSP